MVYDGRVSAMSCAGSVLSYAIRVIRVISPRTPCVGSVLGSTTPGGLSVLATSRLVWECTPTTTCRHGKIVGTITTRLATTYSGVTETLSLHKSRM